MTLVSLVHDYGYAAVFAGTCLEGETILLAAAFAAHRGLLDLRGVFLLALAGSFLGDQFFSGLVVAGGTPCCNASPRWAHQ